MNPFQRFEKRFLRPLAHWMFPAALLRWHRGWVGRLRGENASAPLPPAAPPPLPEPAQAPPQELFPSEQRMRDIARQELLAMLPKTNSGQQPNINALWMLLRDADLVRMNCKNHGTELARQLQPALRAVAVPGDPGSAGLVSKATTQEDLFTPWFHYWCHQLHLAPLFHRKLWEFAFLLQVLHEHGALREGRRGIGFGCGQEPLASYFASRGVAARVTDLDPQQVAGMGWAETGQHATAKEMSYDAKLVARADFDRLVDHAYVDMNAIPPGEQGYDFCWSVCAMEHLGSIEQGLQFVENAMRVLKPGGIAIHTTEYNYLSTQETVDHWPTVLFLRRHFAELADRLAARGHRMLGPDFSVGEGVLDRHVDLPPYAWDEGMFNAWQWADAPQAHLRLAVDGFACTCFGIVVVKAA